MNSLKTSCPVDALLKIVGQKWSLYILHTVKISHSIRFGALKKQIPGISQKILTSKLRELERAKIINRDYVGTIPPQVSYSLSAQGLELIPILDIISEVAHDWRVKELL